jgi:hypothetical protein
MHALRGDCGKNFGVIAKAARVPELVDFEDVIDARCVVTQKFARTLFKKSWKIRYG